MKTLTVSALVCAMMALTRAAALPEETPESGQPAKSHLVKRSTSCPRGWTEIRGRCFLYVPRAMSWAKAERNCLSMGANLASVRKAKEYHAIQKMIAVKTHGHPQTWIGGSDGEEEGVWLWSDGTPFTFTYWCRGEPNNSGNQHCLQMNHTGNKCWDDAQCYCQRPSVCVKRMWRFLG